MIREMRLVFHIQACPGASQTYGRPADVGNERNAVDEAGIATREEEGHRGDPLGFDDTGESLGHLMQPGRSLRMRLAALAYVRGHYARADGVAANAIRRRLGEPPAYTR